MVSPGFNNPGFNNPEYKGDFYDRHHSLHYEIEFPENISELLQEDSFLISVKTENDWSYRWLRMTFHEDQLNMTDAEEFCVSQWNARHRRVGHISTAIST